MIEVLVAVILVAIGFLAIARMQVQGLSYSHSAYNRSQAHFMANDIIDRMRANVQGVVDGNYDNKSTTSTYESHACSVTACTPAQTAQNDLAEWRKYLYPDNNATPALPGTETIVAKGTVVAKGDNAFTVNITWAENNSVQPLSVSFVAQSIE